MRFGLPRPTAGGWERCKLPEIATEPRPRIVAANLAFGDADSKTLYITACTHLFRIRLKVPGVRPGPPR
jgi:sugar lactone lactonase YvrE